MTGELAQVTPKANKKRKFANSPLYIVGLFCGLVEVGCGVAMAVSSEWLQAAILVFMLLFAIGIASAFFVFLWKRPWVFYPPSEFGPTTVEAYVGAMHQGTANISSSAVRSLSLALADEGLLHSFDVPEISSKCRRSTALKVLDDVRERAIKNVRASVIRLDARPLQGPHGAQWEELYDADLPVWQFLDRVWLRLQPFGPHAYGTVWLVRDSSGRMFDEIGPAWAGRRGGDRTKDERPLGESGITGGMSLEVVPVNAHRS